jgi:hypothetical protein
VMWSSCPQPLARRPEPGACCGTLLVVRRSAAFTSPEKQLVFVGVALRVAPEADGDQSLSDPARCGRSRADHTPNNVMLVRLGGRAVRPNPRG